MTKEEKQKAIDALKISAPIMAVTQEEFSDYIQTLNKIMDWLEREPILDKIRAEIEPKCDRINSLASVLPYTAHREIQELLCEVMNLCKAESEEV